jgi:hypothetical protein
MRDIAEFRHAIGEAVGRLNDMSDTEVENARAALKTWLAQCDAQNAVNKLRKSEGK